MVFSIFNLQRFYREGQEENDAGRIAPIRQIAGYGMTPTYDLSRHYAPGSTFLERPAQVITRLRIYYLGIINPDSVVISLLS